MEENLSCVFFLFFFMSLFLVLKAYLRILSTKGFLVLSFSVDLLFAFEANEVQALKAFLCHHDAPRELPGNMFF